MRHIQACPSCPSCPSLSFSTMQYHTDSMHNIKTFPHEGHEGHEGQQGHERHECGFSLASLSTKKYFRQAEHMETCFSHAEGPSEELYRVAIASFFGRSWVAYRSDPVVILSCSTRHHIPILRRVHNGGTYSLLLIKHLWLMYVKM